MRVVCVFTCAPSPYLFLNVCWCADVNQVLRWASGASNGPPSTLNAYGTAREFFRECCLNDCNVPSTIADRKQFARGEKCRRYFETMTSESELQHLKDRQYDTGAKEILLEHLDHLVISSLAVVFIDLGLQVPRDLQRQFEGSKWYPRHRGEQTCRTEEGVDKEKKGDLCVHLWHGQCHFRGTPRS